MRPAYAIPRIIRHFLPRSVSSFLLQHSLVIRPGLETSDPASAVKRYLEVLSGGKSALEGRRVLVFGYGGRFDLGLHLVDAGADYVALCDRFARPDDLHNRMFLQTHAKYLTGDGGRTRPRAERMRLIEADLRLIPTPPASERYDIVVSTSVFEHLDDASGVTESLAQWTRGEGLHIHYVDLRDHFFRFPFEMLRYSEATWRRWFNPSSNLNRLRLWDYRAIFERVFERVDIDVLERDVAALRTVRSEIRPEFVSGNLDDDSATLIRIVARSPRHTP